jgi:hypothetical protein
MKLPKLYWCGFARIGTTSEASFIYINKTMKQAYRHGDVPFHPIEELKGKKIKHNGEHILAWGDKTGHNHKIIVEDPTTLDIYQVSENTWCLDLRSNATVTHPEHKTLEIIPGRYFVGREREVDPFTQAVRQVID